ncbi:MAG: RNA polymerase sigma factor SigZ [Caldilinea sp.]|jgi:RNA polymerase sigma-70 factor, ECF subfamily
MSVDFQAIYLDFDQRLRRFIQSKVADADAVEDILQDVYLRIHTHIDDLRDEERLESWIYQITRNAITDLYRRARPQTELSEGMPAPEAEEEGAIQDLAGSVHGMLACLPEKYKQALTLTEIQGMTQVEMAKQLGISISGAKSRVQRAREKLKEAFLDCCHFEFDRLGMVLDYHPKCDQCASQRSCAPLNPCA